jgi:thioredoxin reductase (NADPH)
MVNRMTDITFTHPTADCEVDVAIVGAGPAGLAAAAACIDHGLSYALLDRRGLGQSFVEYPHALRFFSPPEEMEIGGVPLPVAGGHKPTRETYLAYLRSVVRARGITLSPWRSIGRVDRIDGGGYRLATRLEPDAGPGGAVTARAVVLAVGVWREPIVLPVEGGRGPNVFSEFTDPTPFTGCEVTVVGGGNSALGAALSLAEARARVTLVMRRPPKAYRSGVRPHVRRDLGFAVNEGRVRLLCRHNVTRIGPRSVTAQPVRYTGRWDLWEGTAADYAPDGEPLEVPGRFVFALLGHRSDAAFLRDVMGLDLRGDGRPVCDETTWETPRENIFLAGSLCSVRLDIVLKIREQAAGVVAAIARRLRDR